jgi:hypothetical protein
MAFCEEPTEPLARDLNDLKTFRSLHLLFRQYPSWMASTARKQCMDILEA